MASCPSSSGSGLQNRVPGCKSRRRLQLLVEIESKGIKCQRKTKLNLFAKSRTKY